MSEFELGKTDGGNTGFVYLAETESMLGLVKIGKAGDVQKRMKELGVPGILPYKALHSCEVQNPFGVERRLHEVFAYCRETRDREIFRVDWRAVKAAMQMMQWKDGAVISVTETAESGTETVSPYSLLKWVKANNIEKVRRVLEQKPKGKTDQADREHKTALMWAADLGYTEIAKLLLEYHADPAKAHKSQPPPIFWAAKNGHAGIVQLLLDAGEDANTKWNGQSVLSVATHAEIEKILLDNGANANPAVKSVHSDIVDKLTIDQPNWIAMESVRERMQSANLTLSSHSYSEIQRAFSANGYAKSRKLVDANQERGYVLRAGNSATGFKIAGKRER